ncbi:hypothetical protein [Paenibacillus xerothermodurans]|nr:hypothetical protein [Paenibacillus xerothermodurans]
MELTALIRERRSVHRFEEKEVPLGPVTQVRIAAVDLISVVNEPL